MTIPITCRRNTWLGWAIVWLVGAQLLPAASRAEDGPGPGDAATSHSLTGSPAAGGRAATQPDSALAQKLAEWAGEPLELADAIRLTLANATVVGEAQALMRSAAGVLRRERGAFDPELFADLARISNDLPSNSPFAGADVLRTDETAAAAGARMRLRFGTELEASLSSRRLTSNSEFAALNPEYRTLGLLEIRQPLLKGFGPAASSDLVAAEYGADAAGELYWGTVLAARAAAESLYWELYAAERDLGVQALITERAAALLDQARTRASAGLVGPNDVANAAVFLAQQQLAEIDLEERLDLLSDELASLMGVRPAGALGRYHPSDVPPRQAVVEPVDVLVSRAHARNRELQSALDELEALRAVERGARWDAFPSLDLVGLLGGNGLAGDTDTALVDLNGGFGTTWDQMWRGDFPTWSVGVELSLPIGLREGRGERDRLQGEIERAEQRIEGIRRRLGDEVRASHRQIEHGARRLEIAERGVEAAYEQVRIGIIEFDNGRTTAFELVRLGADLATAQQQLSDALVRTAKADAELRRLTAADLEFMTAHAGDHGLEIGKEVER